MATQANSARRAQAENKKAWDGSEGSRIARSAAIQVSLEVGRGGDSGRDVQTGGGTSPKWAFIYKRICLIRMGRVLRRTSESSTY
jgi:hypothetical protein